MLGELQAMLFEFLRGADRAQDFVKQLVGCLYFSSYLVEPFVRNVTVWTSSANARPIREMNGVFQLLVYIISHLVAGNTK